MYAEASYAGQPLYGERNPTPAYFQHIADRDDQRRVDAIERRCRAVARRGIPTPPILTAGSGEA